jgi:CHAT domain-containing protein
MPWNRQLLALGDPIVHPASTLSDDQRWARLPQADRELRSIARALPGRAVIHAGADDRKQYLEHGAPLLHLATHAVADTADANRSRILFTPEPGRQGSEYLFRGEVAALPLAGADLVTLSACDTEAGPLARGEGIQSFSRAFLAAGARATVTTLWRVQDSAAADFMTIFYRHLAAGEPKAEALRAAKLSFLAQGGERVQPLYWAAFVLNGDGQEPIRPVVSWMWFAGGLLLAAGIVTGCRFLYFRRRRPYSRATGEAQPERADRRG